MRPQADLPRLPRRPRVEGRGRSVLIIAAVGLFVLIVSLRGIAGFYTDYLWFDSLHLGSVWRGVLGAKIALAVIFTLLFFGLCWANLLIAERIAPAFRPSGPEEDFLERYHDIVGSRAGTVRLAIAGLFALIAGASMSGRWNDWILFTHRVSFGQKDATFHTDIGFYVFQLPFLTAVVSWVFSALLVITIVTTVAHYLNGGIRVQGALERVTPQVKAHLSVLLGVLALVKAGQYWLQRYELTFSTRGTVDGATYTDVNVQLKAIYLLILISLFAFGLFIANIWRRGWVLPALAVGLWVFVALLAGEVVPAFVQRFRVQPSESSKEAPYIRHNIDATRTALNLRDVDVKQFAFDGKINAAALNRNADTVRNIRLWDPAVMQTSYQKLQGIRSFYEINDVDVDRYNLDGKTTQVMLAARDLNRSGVPQDSWEARHLTYTHGYGILLAPANAKTSNGQPKLLERDVPVTTSGGAPPVTGKRAGVYFGEGQSEYVIVNTGRSEIDFQNRSGKPVTTSYSGQDGINIGSGAPGLFRKAAFALRFGDINPLISSNIKSDSRILVQRDIRSRVHNLAPFLAFDHDPYLVAIGGHLEYVIDAYTTTSRYPNAQRADTSSVSDGSGLRGRSFNYVRNSVKAVVDAYDGSVKFYVIDDKDPVIRSYRKAFPRLFTSGNKVPTELRAHFRYPEDLFATQTGMWSKYHVTDPDTFYNRNDEWNVAQDPGVGEAGATTADTSAVTDQNTVPSSDRVDPTYLLTKLPGEKRESFLVLRPFVPTSGDNESKLLTAFMVAKSDPDDYGKLESFVMPASRLPNGPSIVAGQMQSDNAVSQLQTLLCQKGSKCELRNLLVIPIDNSLLFVRSFFVQDESNGIPELRKVIASYQDASNTPHVEVDDTLQGALKKLFGSSPATLEEGGSTTTPSNPSNAQNPSNDTENQLITKIVAAFDTADTAARKGDQVAYARQIVLARKLAGQLADLRKGTATNGGTTGSSTTTTTSPTRDSTTTTTTTVPPSSSTVAPAAVPTTRASTNDSKSTTTTSTST